MAFLLIPYIFAVAGELQVNDEQYAPNKEVGRRMRVSLKQVVQSFAFTELRQAVDEMFKIVNPLSSHKRSRTGHVLPNIPKEANRTQIPTNSSL